jgi:hypothetical protein
MPSSLFCCIPPFEILLRRSFLPIAMSQCLPFSTGTHTCSALEAGRRIKFVQNEVSDRDRTFLMTRIRHERLVNTENQATNYLMNTVLNFSFLHPRSLVVSYVSTCTVS